MESLRTPFFIAAILIALVVVLVEIGSLALSQTPNFAAAVSASCTPPPQDDQMQKDCKSGSSEQTALLNTMADARNNNPQPPGLGITYMALVDGVVLFSALMMGLAFIIPLNVLGRLQGIATLIFSILMLVLSIGLIFLALGKVILMITLLLDVPFGTIAYLAIWGFFDRGGASIILSLLWLLKLAFGVCLVLAQQRFLQNKGLIFIFVASLVANIVVSFLQGLVPDFLVSITDAIAAIMVAIIAAILLIIALIGSIVAIVKALKPAI